MNWKKWTIISFYLPNVDPEIPAYQERVFRKFGVPLQQILVENSPYNQESEVMAGLLNEYVPNITTKYCMIFDIDAIPLTAEVFSWYKEQMDKGSLVGPAQRSNHLNNGCHVFCAPSALGFAMDTYRALGYPSFMPDIRSDNAENLTWVAEEKGIPVIKIPPKKAERLLWPLEGTKKVYGEGTNYDDKIFHAFNIRSGSTNRLFIDMARTILGLKKRSMFSVVIPSARPSGILKRAIESVQQAADTVQQDVEIIVVLDGTIAPLSVKAKNCKYVHLPFSTYTELPTGTGGIPRAVGSLIATGYYICYLDDDNTYTQQHFKTLLAVINNTNAELIHSRRFLYDGMKCLGKDDFESIGINTGIHAAQGGLIDTNCMCIKKSWAVQLSGMWARFGISTEDRTITQAARIAGVRVADTGAYTVCYNLPKHLVNSVEYWEIAERYRRNNNNE